MSLFKNHSVIPENSKSSYSEFDIIDFICTFPNRKMLANTVRLSYTLRVLQGNVALSKDNDVMWSSRVGGHNIIEGITTETQLQGQLESIHDYPRQVQMIAGATLDINDFMNASKSCELRTPDDQYSRLQFVGETPNDHVPESTVNLDNSVSLKPIFCLNRVSSSDNDVGVSYNRVGNVRVSLQLSRILDAFYGRDVANGVTTYSISNPRLEFVSVPDDNKQNNLQFRVSNSLRQIVNSKLSNLGLKAPVIANSCSVSFILQERQSQGAYDNTACEQLPNVSRLDFTWNNATNQGITYTIRDNIELTHRYLESLQSAGHNCSSLPLLSANKSYGIGISFNEFIDLSKTMLNVQITSEVNSTNPYTAIFYFNGILQL
jgi:hypothetical protein